MANYHALVRCLHVTTRHTRGGLQAALNGQSRVLAKEKARLEARPAEVEEAEPLTIPPASRIASRKSSAPLPPRSNDAAASTENLPIRTPEARLSTLVRSLMRSMPHSVVVVTSTAPYSSKKGESTPIHCGMTISSFTTVTLDPVPIVTFNIRAPSSTLEAIRASHHFHIHILDATIQGALVADTFSKRIVDVVANGNDTQPPMLPFQDPKPRISFESFDESKKHKEEERRVVKNDSISPPLLTGDGIMRVLRCELLSSAPNQGLISIGDHVVVVGKVIEIVKQLETNLVNPEERQPWKGKGLCYADGEYRLVSEPLNVLRKR